MTRRLRESDDDSGVCFQTLLEFVTEKYRRRRGASGVIGLRLRLSAKALLSWIFQRRRPPPQVTCDVLVVHPSRKSFEIGRKAPLIAALRSRGLAVEEYVEDSDVGLLRKFQFFRPAHFVPLLLRWDAAHAAYLLTRYRTKAILTERNGWLVPTFLRKLRDGEPKVVHLAHSVPSGESSRYDYFDYDFYLLFGASSLEYLSSLKPAFGKCTVIFSGPYFFRERVCAAPSDPMIREEGLKCLFVASGPDYEISEQYKEYCKWVLSWMESQADAKLSVKSHPRGTGQPWVQWATRDSKIELLPGDIPLDEVAAAFDLVFMSYTNAVLDVSRCGTPFVLLGGGPDHFSASRFGIARAGSAAELVDAANAVLRDVPEARRNALKFFQYHVAEGSCPVASIVRVVETVVSEGEMSGAFLPS